jgi:hypothetical protein
MARSQEIVHERAHEPTRSSTKLRIHSTPAATSSVYSASRAFRSNAASPFDADHAAASTNLHAAGWRTAEEKHDAVGVRRLRLSRRPGNPGRDYLLDGLSRKTAGERIAEQP